MAFTMSYGEPQTPASEAAPAPKRKRAPASVQAQADRKTRRDTLKDKADALFEPSPAAAPEAQE